MLAVEPCRAEREVEAAVGDVVDRHRLGGEHRGVPVRHAGDEQAEADRGRLSGKARQGGHALEALTRALAVHGLEVVEAPRPLEAQLLGELHPTHDLVPGHALLRDIDTRTAWPASLRWNVARPRAAHLPERKRGRDKTVEMLGSVTTASS